MPTLLKHAPKVRLPRLTTHCGPMTPFCAWVWPSGAGKTSQEAVCAHVLATRSAGWRVPASTTLIPRCFEPQSGRTWPTNHLSLGEGLSRERWLVLGFSHRFVLTGGLRVVAAWNPRWFPSSSTLWPSTPRADATAQTRDHRREGQASSSTSAQRTPLHDTEKIRRSLLPCLVVRSP